MSEEKAEYKTVELRGIKVPLHRNNPQIIIDGNDITKYVRNVDLRYGLDSPIPIVTLELQPFAVEIPDEIMAILEIKEREQNPMP